MTHLTILALGSRGDVLPYVVLGQGLQAAGFTVRVVSFESFGPMVTRHGLDFAAVPGDAQAMLTGGAGLALAESGQNVWRMWQSLKSSFWELATDIARTLSQPQIWQTDGIINQLPGGLYGMDLAERLQIPYIAAAVMPLMRTRTYPMLAFPPALSFLPGYNALSYRLAEQIVWSGFRKAINRWRQEVLGLPAQPFFGEFGHTAQLPTLLGYSEAMVPRPPDWGPNIYLTGYWRPEEPSWTPPPALVDFLASGPPPVFVGFGSMAAREPQRITRIVLEALRLSGQRAILHVGWAGLGQVALPDTVFPLDYAPYSWLFPRMAALVHHGGSGTTGFGIWAGVPAVVTPFLFDQFFWGKRIAALGVGPEPLPQKKLTANALAGAIETAVSDSAIHQRATALSRKIREEDGVGTAVAIVHHLMQEGDNHAF